MAFNLLGQQGRYGDTNPDAPAAGPYIYNTAPGTGENPGMNVNPYARLEPEVQEIIEKKAREAEAGTNIEDVVEDIKNELPPPTLEQLGEPPAEPVDYNVVDLGGAPTTQEEITKKILSNLGDISDLDLDALAQGLEGVVPGLTDVPGIIPDPDPEPEEEEEEEEEETKVYSPFVGSSFAGGGSWFRLPDFPGRAGQDTYMHVYNIKGGVQVYYLATKATLDSIYGVDGLPPNAQLANYESFKQGKFYAGMMNEVLGKTDNYASIVERALLGGSTGDLELPSWVTDNEELMGIFYVAISEKKDTSWMIKSMAKTQAFKERFPKIDKLISIVGDAVTAVQSFVEMEQRVDELNNRYGLRGTPEAEDATKLVSVMIDKGYTVDDLEETYKIFDLAGKHSTTLNAFQSVLTEKGFNFDLSNNADMVAFFKGTAPTEIYDLYEASSILEQSARFTIGLDAEKAIELAMNTPGQIETRELNTALQQAAMAISRYREEINLQKYGLNSDDIINAALGIHVPGVGLSSIELEKAFSRIMLEEQALQNIPPIDLTNVANTRQRQIRSV